MAKILAFVLAVSLVFPVSAFASVADLADDTRAPGKSLANTYPNLPVDWQVSLAEDAKDVTVRVPVSLTADELTAAIEAQSISFSLVRDGERQYLNPEKFPNPWEGGTLDQWVTQNNKETVRMFDIKEMGVETDNDGKVHLKLLMDINCYFYTTRFGAVDYSAPHNNGGAYLDVCGYFNFNAIVAEKTVGSVATKVVPYDTFRTIYELYDDVDALANAETDLYVSRESMGRSTTDGYDIPYVIIADQKASVDRWLEYTELVEQDPDLVLAQLKEGKWDDLRVPMFASNVHSNENAAVNGILEFGHMLLENETVDVKTLTSFTDAGKALLAEEMARNNAKTPDLIKDYASYLGYIRGENGYNHWTTSSSSKGLYSGQLDLEKYYNVETETVNIKELLTDVFVVIVPE